MAERWQQWMPLHIDRWKGSAHVQAMHPCARVGYLYLLTCAWQSEDCSVPSNPDELADLSGLGVALWNEHAARILRRFTTEADRLVNEVLRDEWREAKRIFESRSHAAKKTNSGRSLDGDRTPTGQSPTRSADTITGTDTSTGTKAKPTRVQAASVVLPEWVDAEVWEGYLDVRRKKRAVLTERALMAVLKQLAQFRARGHDANAILETSMRSNWTDVYEPKGVGNGTNQINHVRGQQRVDQAIDELRKAGVEIPDRRAEESAGEVRPATRGGDGRDPPGVVLEGSG